MTSPKQLPIWFCIAAISAGALDAQDSRVAWLHGRLIDRRGSAVPGIHVHLSSGTQRCDGVSNAEGIFNCTIPAGDYELTADGANIMPFRAAMLKMKAGEHTFYTIRPVFRSPSDSATPDPILKYEVRLIGGQEALVRFGSSDSTSDQIVFRGDYLMLAYAGLTIYAQEISCSATLGFCTAKGSVLADVAYEHLAGTELTIDLVQREFRLTREPVIEKEF